MSQPWHGDQRPVIAGLDSSQRARTAALWAAAEAALRRVELHLVHSSPPRPSTAINVPSPRGSAGPAAQHLLHDVLRACVHAQPSLTAHTHLEVVPASTALVRWSEKAQLVVVGHHGEGNFTGLMVGSVCAALGERGRCPVVVVRSPDSTIPTHRGPVVLGLGDSSCEDTAIDFAFAAAARARCPLIALRTWWTDLDEDVLGGLFASAPDAQRHDIGEQVRAALASAQRDYPDVPTSVLVVHGRRGPTLLAEVERGHPQLLVLAANDRGVPQGLLGPTARNMLHHAECPVAIVAPARKRVSTASLPGTIEGQL